jgi:predicted GNAT family acetyltransferase
MEHIEQILPVHAQMAFEECGINPIEKDPIGFRERVASRIKKGRVWIFADQGLLICKADVVSQTPEQIYLEGVYVDSMRRGQGYGTRFVSQLGRTLLAKTKSLCVLANQENRVAQLFYQKAGYKLRGYYDTIYLEQHESLRSESQVH